MDAAVIYVYSLRSGRFMDAAIYISFGEEDV